MLLGEGGGAQWPQREKTLQCKFVCHNNTFSLFSEGPNCKILKNEKKLFVIVFIFPCATKMNKTAGPTTQQYIHHFDD